MYKNKKILAVIPARGGSKGIPNKNLQDLAGTPLIGWTIREALNSKTIDRLIVSTDSNDIATVARDLGGEVPFLRPAELANDLASSESVLAHALEQVGDGFDCILLLQPTSPFRTAQHVDNMIAFAIDEEFDQVVSMSPVKKHPYLMYFLRDDHDLVPALPVIDKPFRRQDYPPIFEMNGALYFSLIPVFNSLKTLKGPNMKGYALENYVNIDLDEPNDLEYARFIAQRVLKSKAG